MTRRINYDYSAFSSSLQHTEGPCTGGIERAGESISYALIARKCLTGLAKLGTRGTGGAILRFNWCLL